MPSLSTPAEPQGASVAVFPCDAGLPHLSVGSASASRVSGPHRAFPCVTARIFAGSPSDPFHRKLQRIRYLLRRFDCYWASDPSQAGLAPAKIHAPSRRTDRHRGQRPSFRENLLEATEPVPICDCRTCAVVLGAMNMDKERISRIRRALRQAKLDALILRLPENIVMSFGVWPINGFSYAVFTADAGPWPWWPHPARTRKWTVAGPPRPATSCGRGSGCKTRLRPLPGISGNWPSGMACNKGRIGYEGVFECLAPSHNAGEVMVPNESSLAWLKSLFPGPNGSTRPACSTPCGPRRPRTRLPGCAWPTRPRASASSPSARQRNRGTRGGTGSDCLRGMSDPRDGPAPACGTSTSIRKSPAARTRTARGGRW